MLFASLVSKINRFLVKASRRTRPNSGLSEWLLRPFARTWILRRGPRRTPDVPTRPTVKPPLCPGRWSPASVARWSVLRREISPRPASDGGHPVAWCEAVSRSGYIATDRDRARVHACLLKTSLGTHEPLSVCVGGAPEGAGASLSIRWC